MPERLRELFRKLSKVIEPGKPIKVTNYRCYRDFYVRTEYTYIPIFRRNMPLSQKKFLKFGGEFVGEISVEDRLETTEK